MDSIWKPKYKIYSVILIVLSINATIAGFVSLFIHPNWFGFVVSLAAGVVGICLSAICYLEIRMAEIYVSALIGSNKSLKEVFVIDYQTKGNELVQVKAYDGTNTGFIFQEKVGGVSVYLSPSGDIAVLESFLTFENLRYFEKKQ